MVDTKSRQERSRNMAAIRSKNTAPELLLRKRLWRSGIRFFTADGWRRLTNERLPGSPDLLFPKARLALFVDGCFWHGCPHHYRQPDDNQQYWSKKIATNIERDRRVNQELHNSGWRVRRVWEHEIKRNVEAVVQDIHRELTGHNVD